MALFLFTTAISSAIAEACTPALADPHLIWPFVGTAVAGFVLAAFFWLMYRDLDHDPFLNRPQEDAIDARNSSLTGSYESASDREKRVMEKSA